MLDKNDSILIDNQFSTYTISARGKTAQEDALHFIKRCFNIVPITQIESLFGFVERSTLYGGRFFQMQQLSESDVKRLNEIGIGLRIPLTNHFATTQEYQQNRAMLKKYHNPLNSIICTNDDLAMWIKNEFTDYDIEASVIKNITKLEQIEDAFKIYDTVVLPMSANDDDILLNSITHKHRIRLFANAGCAYTCPAKICYKSFSKFNKSLEGELKCSQEAKDRPMKGMIDFDLQRLRDKGYNKFKLLQARIGNGTGY
ncbi:hypothetical protein [Pseudoalteromonas denitrificans]|uniref:Peptidase family U32 n=1 Tax=Pseudoalteromonas denitrificans DSM 6059 TaxID=1123010 RepID=A0A1I1PP93_9GAMM|nr:hypothetical protein [Pseudoalteromonas denitrificans]SFD11477.1 hypothetical protein SAMN02745724_03535 [Pseudoalteromonas denitrificans DSM 6059]